MLRRSFIQGILGAMIPPAIVRADSLMKMVIPKPESIFDFKGSPKLNSEFTMESWLDLDSPNLMGYHHICVTQNNGAITEYVDGRAVRLGVVKRELPGFEMRIDSNNILHINDTSGRVKRFGELRLTWCS
jgi:hypothetical protein